MEKKYLEKWRLQWPECSINLCWEQEGASSNYQWAKPTCTPISPSPPNPTTSVLSLNRKLCKIYITWKTALANVNNIQFFQSFAFISDRSPWQSLNLGPITPQTRRKHLIILRLSSDVSYLLNEPIHLPPCLMCMERGGSSWVIRRGGGAAKKVSREPWGSEEGSQKLFL